MKRRGRLGAKFGYIFILNVDRGRAESVGKLWYWDWNEVRARLLVHLGAKMWADRGKKQWIEFGASMQEQSGKEL